MGKYTTAKSQVAGDESSVGCSEARALAIGAAVAYDPVDPGCWRVTGKGIEINDTNGVQYLFEMFNFNMRQDGTSSPVPNQYDLPGARK